MKIIIINIFLLFLYPAILVADTIYKSVDEEGNVTYSSTPVQNSERSTSVDIAPPPSEESVEAAQNRLKRDKKTADNLDENRKKRNEIIAEENRLKRDNQKKSQQQEPAEINNYNQDYDDDYLGDRSRRPVVIRPPIQRPPSRPVQRTK